MKKLMLGVLVSTLCSASFAQSWPARPVRVLVGFAPGGTADLSARVTGNFVSRELRQNVIIENRPGGSGSVGIEAMLRSEPDGYTIYVGSDSSFYQPVLKPALSYRPERDLQPITILTKQPIIIAVHPSPGWKSVADLVKAAKARPGQIPYAISSPTSTQALAGLMFCHMAKVKMVAVPYKGGGQAVVDLVSGNVPVAIIGAAPLAPQAKAGRIKLLAITSRVRSKAFPDVPTLAELGYPDMDITQWFGAVAPAGTPSNIVTLLSSAMNKALADSKVEARLFNAGLEVVGGTPEEMRQRMHIETALWSKAAKEAGLGKN